MATPSNQPQRRGAAGCGAELLAHILHLPADLVVKLDRKRSVANASAVGLADPVDLVERARRKSGAGRGKRGSGVAAGDIGIDAPIEIAHDTELTLEQNVVAGFQRHSQHRHGVDDTGGQLQPELHQKVVYLAPIDRLTSEDRQFAVDGAQGAVQAAFEPLRMQQVAHTQAGAGGLVAVGGPDASHCGADRVCAPCLLFQLIELAMVRQYHLGAAADPQPVAADAD